MSKKQHQLNRLKSLFFNLEEPAQPAEAAPDRVREPVPASPPKGWTWDLDEEGNYLSCSPEMSEVLGLATSDVLGRSMRTFRLHPQSIARLSETLSDGIFPCDVNVNFQHARGHWILVRLSILSGPSKGSGGIWRGFAQAIPAGDRQPTPEKEISSPGVFSQPDPLGAAQTKHLEIGEVEWFSTPEASPIHPRSLTTDSSSAVGNPSVLEVPFQAGQAGNLLLEVIDERSERIWTEDERLLISEVTNQLSSALENARLYMAVQQELSERVRAEQVILHRNQDLAILNQIGQRLSSLESRNEVYRTLTDLVGQVLDNHNLMICVFEHSTGMVSFPIYREDGQVITIPDRFPSSELPDYVLTSQKTILLTRNIPQYFQQLDIVLPRRTPTSLIAIPMNVGEDMAGALIVQNYSGSDAPQFDEVHLELLSTAVSQAATALQNARLFEQMQEALLALEKRERYQGGVAQAAGSLSQLGSHAISEVLKTLGHAAQASRVYLIEYQPNETGPTWKLADDWTSPMVAYLFNRSKIQGIPAEVFSDQLTAIRTNGWGEFQADQSSGPLGTFLASQNIHTSLIMQVTSKDSIPNLLVFDQIDRQRNWLKDEISILEVAADAISNTYVREDLLNQLQASLEETESLYNASNRLVAAGDYQDMLAAIISGLKTSGLNRGILLLYEHDNFGKIIQVTVRGNWYSGYGTPPPSVGTKYPLNILEKLLLSNSQVFVDDISMSSLDESLCQVLLQQNVVSLAVLPMWSGKRQIGSFLIEGDQKHRFVGRETRILPPLVDQLTITVENMHLFEQTQTALAETALLYNISSSIAQAQDMDQMIEQVIINVLPRGAEGAAVILFHLNEQQEIVDLEFAGHRTLSNQSPLRGWRMTISDLPAMRMLSDEGLIFEDTQAESMDPFSRRSFKIAEIGAIALVPMRSGGRLIGALAAIAKAITQFDPADVRLLRTVANGIAVALEKQRLLREAQRRALELQTASEIARDTTSTLSLDLLLNRIVNLLAERFNYSHTAIYFIDDAGHYAVIREATGEVGAELVRRGHKLLVGSRSVVGMATGSGEVVMLNDVSHSPIFMAHPLLPETRAEMTLPLRIGKHIIGALDIQVQQENAFSQEDVNVLGILTDQISIAIENARAYELSQKAIEDMREVDRVKSQFLANMSHELRTPLNSIIGFSRVIIKGIDGPVNETQKQDLNAIYSSGQHLLLLINDILDLSKIEAGKMELSFSDVNLADMINSAMSTAVGLVKDKPIQLVSNLPKDLPMVRADSTRIRQVLINFLSNAAKFTDQGSITVEAGMSLSPANLPELIVTVTDTGPGIAESDRSKLFLPFSQVDDSPTRKTGGTGLGLSICRSLIDMHAGRIGLLHSQIGVGSTFFFSLPLPVSAPPVPEPAANLETENWTILSVDDDIQVINLYQRYLNPQGYTVVPHTNPLTVTEAVTNLQPKAILLDVMMAGRDGWQILQELKTNPATRQIPIVVCSILENEEKGFNLGAADYLVKPFSQDELLHSLQRLQLNGQIKQILVVDDDPEDLRLVEKMLSENKNYQVRLAKGGIEGLEIAHREQPDAIVLDLFMQDLDGFSLLSSLRMDAELKNVPIVILTGTDLTLEQHQKIQEYGIKFIAKGYQREKELINAIEESLRKLRSPQP